MNAPRIISGLGDIAADYDALLCDAWGVIHNGRELYPGAAEALSSFKANSGPVIILTNAPRLSNVIPLQLDRLGLPRAAYDGVVTSGDATREAMHQLADKKFYRIGPGKDDGLFESVDITMTTFDEAEAIFCSGPNNDTHETPEDYRSLLADAVARDMPMVCANPDILVKFGDQLIYCAGALGQLHEELGGKVILGGKPHAPIYELARTQMIALKGTAPKRVLVVGDGLDTDIRGANNQDYDVVFVAAGIFAEASRGEDGRLSPARLEAALTERGVHAQFAMEELAW